MYDGVLQITAGVKKNGFENSHHSIKFISGNDKTIRWYVEQSIMCAII